MSKRILVVEDETDLATTLAYNLTIKGYTPSVVSDGNAALAALQADGPFDLVLLDLMLPDISGKDVCRYIRQDATLRSLPVIMITARGHETDRVVGFELGADDYVVKPYSIRELMLRIEALLRRTNPSIHADEPILIHGILKLDVAGHRVWVRDQAVRLTALEFKLLRTLLERKGRVQTRARLLGDVWGYASDLNTRTVDTHIRRLRDKIGDAGHLIDTVRGVGYCLNASADLE